jgi:hypothetical protein
MQAASDIFLGWLRAPSPGGSARFDNAVANFAEAYANQNERDHAALAAAVSQGRVRRRPCGPTRGTRTSAPRPARW